MNVEQIGQLIKCVVTYFIPIASFILSIYSIYRSSKVSALEQKVNEYDLKLKKYELERMERANKLEAKIEARIIRISKSSHKIRISNVGNTDAFDVDYFIPEQYNIIVMKDNGVTPLEVLKSGESIDVDVVIHKGSSKKYEVTTNWKDIEGKTYSNTEVRVRD